jgi:multicomponent K+:H+ antiporter subunit D
MIRALVEQLPVLPIVVPMIAGAALLLLGEARRRTRVTIAFASLAVQLAAAVTVLYRTTDAVPDVWAEGVGVYALGGWPAPFGIVLVVDRLSGLMLTLTATIAIAVLAYSVSRWDRPAQPFHSLYQFLLMGVNGAFLTGDLFNLFVFFEVLLVSSYGLALRGVGTRRVARTLHYIAVNLVASLLFLIGVALIYGIAGTLNMADLSGKVAALGPEDRALFDAGAAILGVAFLIKAGSWPLNFWLPGTYSAAMAPVGASFAMLTKVGVYSVLRVGTLLSSDQTAADIVGWIMFYGGLLTLAAGTIGLLATQHLARLVSYSVIISSGLLLAALGLGIEALTAPVLLYLITSALTTATFFMLTGMTDRARVPTAAQLGELASVEAPDETRAPEPLVPEYVSFGIREPDPYGTDAEVGAAIPGARAFLGLMFIGCVLLVTGLPPLPSFIAKFALLSTTLEWANGTGLAGPAWAFCIAVLATGFAAVIALARAGTRLFWTGTARRTPRLHVLEAAPVAVLVLLCLGISVASGPVMGFLEATARSLHEPTTYIRTVLAAREAAGAPEGVR